MNGGTVERLTSGRRALSTVPPFHRSTVPPLNRPTAPPTARTRHGCLASGQGQMIRPWDLALRARWPPAAPVERATSPRGDSTEYAAERAPHASSNTPPRWTLAHVVSLIT